VEVTVKKLRKPAIVYKIAPSGNSTSGPQNSKCGKCGQVLATKMLLWGFVLSQAAITFIQACGYLPCRRASPPLGQYQAILLSDRNT